MYLAESGSRRTDAGFVFAAVRRLAISPAMGRSKPSILRDRMTRYSISHRIKLSHLLLLFCVGHIALPLGINRLAKCNSSASNLLNKLFYQADISLRRDSLAKRLTLASFGLGDGSLAPVQGEPRKQSKEFKSFPKSKIRMWELMYPK